MRSDPRLPVLLASALLIVALPLVGQAPRITPAGDPSIRDDTIYRLAVDPAQYPAEDIVYLLRDAVVRIDANGTATRVYREVAQILSQKGAEQWGEHTFSYNGSDERFTLNWMRVVRPDGRIISARPTEQQESVAPIVAEAPQYSDVKWRHLTLGGVTAGTIVDYSYTRDHLLPEAGATFLYSWDLSTTATTRRTRFLLDVPSSLKIRLKTRNVRPTNDIRDIGGRRVYTWALSDVHKVDWEPFAADSNDVWQTISVSGPGTWEDIARWYRDLASDRYMATPALDSQLTAVVAGAKTLADSLRALHRWVAQDIRYVSISYGLGGYQPRFPAQVLETRYGDCKDKTTLFIALAHRLHVDVNPVLVNVSDLVERDQPSVWAFNHMIADVELAGGRRYADLTASYTPFGSIPQREWGRFGLILHADGTAEEVSLPPDSTPSRDDDVFVGELSRDGLIQGHFSDVALGALASSSRATVAAAGDTMGLARAVRMHAAELFPAAEIDSLEMFDPRDLRSVVRVSYYVRAGRAATPTGDGHILTLPLQNYSLSGAVAAVSTSGLRRFPIDAGAVIGPESLTSELQLTLPAGWKARLPPNVTAASVFGTYTSEYSQQGRQLRVTRRLTGTRGIQPPERVGILLNWLREVSMDDVRFIVLSHS
jgi:transglutaminase-like putative cysteine protease